MDVNAIGQGRQQQDNFNNMRSSIDLGKDIEKIKVNGEKKQFK